MPNLSDATFITVIFVSVLALTSIAGLLHDWLSRSHQPHLWPDPVESGRAIATLRYYRDVQDSSD
jgi:hypothetical protein